MASDEPPQGLGNGEGHHEVMTRELAFDLGFEPLSALFAPARGAVTVAAGAIDDVRPPTLFTCIGCRAGLLGPAYRDRMNGFSMLDGDVIPEALHVFRAEGSEDLTEHRHSEILSSWS
jgi:hypothetical protein